MAAVDNVPCRIAAVRGDSTELGIEDATFVRG